ncbi:MAG: ferredoxin [Euryarchaeota archaeon]|nr:ferredoxin [Euryarchaeota archaeon]
MSPKIVYDKKNCEGFFVCSAAAPDHFDEDQDEQKVDLTDSKEKAENLFEKEISEEELEEAIEAAEGCPADVIKVLDDDGEVVAGPKELPIES